MPSEPSLSDRYRSNVSVDRNAMPGAPMTTQGSTGEAFSESNFVMVMTENAEELSIANVGVAFNHQLHDLEQQRMAKAPP